MRTAKVMTGNVVSVQGEASVYDAAQILLSTDVRAAPVVDADGRMIGIVSEADLLHRPEIGMVPAKSWLQRLLAANQSRQARDYIRSHAHRVADVMTREVLTAGEDTELSDIAALMCDNNIKCIPILRDDRLVGIVTRANLLQGLLAAEPPVRTAPGDDDAIQCAVSEAIALHGWSSFRAPKVVVQNGVAYIWGSVADDNVRTAICVAAEYIPGVQQVESYLTLATDHVARDRE